MSKYFIGLFIVIIIGCIGLTIGLVIKNSKEKKTKKIKLVNYNMAWCPASIKLEPEFKKLKKWAKDKDNIKVVDIKCEDNVNECVEQEIRAVPTLVLFVDGKRKASYLSYHSFEAMKKIIKSNQ